MALLLSTAYLPPVEYIAAIAYGMTLSKDEVIPSVIYIEDAENYQKQSYRNRCNFYAGDGVQNLHFPIVHQKGVKIPIREVAVDYSTDWVTQHERALHSAYGTSAFFEYYADDLFAILDAHPESLFGLNLALLRFVLDKIGIRTEIRTTGEYVKPEGIVASGKWKGLPECRIGYELVTDLREVIHPKRGNDLLMRLGLDKEYYQVFAPQMGFRKGLSILDLLFNLGPESIIYLKNL